MRIELVTTGLQVGGAEAQVRDIALGMKSRGHEVGVTSLLEPVAYADRLENAGIAVRSMGFVRGRANLVHLLRAAQQFRGRIREQDTDIVHSHMVHANLFSRVALAATPTPVICTIHSTYEGGRLRDLAYKLTNWGASLNTTVSKAATDRVVGDRVLPRSTLTVPNGIDLSKFSPGNARVERQGPFRWIAVGRLEPAKDYPTLLNALAMVPGALATIVGQGGEEPRLEDMISRLDLATRVSLLGVRDDVPELLRDHDGYVLSSSWEGFGIAIVEAMASGLPVVVTDSGGPSEVVGNDGAVGVLVPPGDSAALAEAMLHVASLPPSARSAMGTAGRLRAEALFELGSVLDRWETIYRSVADRRKTAIH